MNASQRRLLVWALVVAAAVLHFSCWSWRIAAWPTMSHPIIPLGVDRNAEPPENLTKNDAVDFETWGAKELELQAKRGEWRKQNQWVPADYFGLQSKAAEPALYGTWAPLALLVVSAFLWLGRRPSAAPQPPA